MISFESHCQHHQTQTSLCAPCNALSWKTISVFCRNQLLNNLTPDSATCAAKEEAGRLYRPMNALWMTPTRTSRALLGIAIVHQLLGDAPRVCAWISSSGESMVSRNMPNQQVLAAGRADCLTQSVDTKNSQRKTQPKNPLYKAASILT